jgi:hypothetical protein
LGGDASIHYYFIQIGFFERATHHPGGSQQSSSWIHHHGHVVVRRWNTASSGQFSIEW